MRDPRRAARRGGSLFAVLLICGAALGAAGGYLALQRSPATTPEAA